MDERRVLIIDCGRGLPVAAIIAAMQARTADLVALVNAEPAPRDLALRLDALSLGPDPAAFDIPTGGKRTAQWKEETRGRRK